MKVLLVAVNAKYIHSNLAVYSLKRYVRDTDADVEIVNYTINNLKEDIIRGIYEKKPDVVAFSTYIWNVEYVKYIAKEIKKICENVKTWFGGPEVSYEPQKFLQENPYADLIMLLEGEETFKELVSGKPYKDVKSIIYRDDDKIISNPLRETMDMDKIPFVYDDLTEFENRIIYYESSRGCPFSCSYCLSSIEKSVRFRSLELVKKELKFFLDNKVPQVKFVDRTFNCNHKRTKELWQFITENDNGITNFHFEISADLIDDEEIEMIGRMREGLIQLEIGVQTTYADTIKEIKRSMRLDRLKEVVDRIHAYGNTHEHLDLIAGLPFETLDIFKKSFNDVYAMKPDELQLGFLKVLKGSYMYSMRESYGLIYTDYPPYEVLKTNWLSYEDVLTLKRIEDMVEVYYNSGQYKNSVKYLEGLFSDAYELYENLADYYTKQSLWEKNHTRISRYEYLYDFAKKSGADIRIFGQILLYDLYLREKLKKRPEFAPENPEYKAFIKDLYRNEAREYKDKMSHIEPFTVNMDTFLPIEGVKYVLFDYDNRSRLGNYAAAMVIKECDL